MKPTRTKILLAFLVIAVIGFSYSYYEARNIILREYDFSHANIPESFDGKKIVFIADIHCNYFFDTNDVRKLVKRINALEPDFVFIGGDIVNSDSIYLNPFSEEISKLESTYGSYFVLGNHDHWNDSELISSKLIANGIIECDNKSYWIKEGKDSIKIGGVGDLWEDEQIIGNTTNDLSSDDFSILLSHNPDYIDELEGENISLVLSGHNHGGQVTFFGLYAPILPSLMHNKPVPQTGQKYRYGWKRTHHIDMYVTSGIGVGDFPFRFFAPPEIVEITLRRE